MSVTRRGCLLSPLQEPCVGDPSEGSKIRKLNKRLKNWKGQIKLPLFVGDIMVSRKPKIIYR